MRRGSVVSGGGAAFSHRTTYLPERSGEEEDMEAIPLNRTTSLQGFVTFLRTLGAPVDRGLRRAQLPVWFEELPHGWVPSTQQWQFIADMARREGIPDLGLQVALTEGPQGLDPTFGRPIAPDYQTRTSRRLSAC